MNLKLLIVTNFDFRDGLSSIFQLSFIYKLYIFFFSLHQYLALMKKIVHILLLTFTCSVCFSVSAQEKKTETTNTIAKQEEIKPTEVIAYENKIVVENAPIGSLLEVYSVVGTKVREIEMKQASGEYYVNIAKGYYIIRIGDTVRKIAIR